MIILTAILGGAKVPETWEPASVYWLAMAETIIVDSPLLALMIGIVWSWK